MFMMVVYEVTIWDKHVQGKSRFIHTCKVSDSWNLVAEYDN